MNPNLSHLHRYPFEKLAELKANCSPPRELAHIALSIGEPKHPAPEFVLNELSKNRHGYSNYPQTKGSDALRGSIATWLVKRFNLDIKHISPEKHILPVNGTREALFAIAQAVIDTNHKPQVMMPNPFYQIYEGAAILAGAEPVYLNTIEDNGFLPDFNSISAKQWQRCQLIYICSPGNPTGRIMPKEMLTTLIELSEKYNFTIVSDECYSELYFAEGDPPVGLLEVAESMGNTLYKNCLVFHSLSKRSNLPGLRSGFVAGDEQIIQQFLRYRTYHGSAMPLPHQIASAAAWADEQHVIQNRELYREKFKCVIDILSDSFELNWPEASFYLWPKTPIDDEAFAQTLFAEQNVTVLPGKYLSRESNGINPGASRIRMALVAELEECQQAAYRIREFMKNY